MFGMKFACACAAVALIATAASAEQPKPRTFSLQECIASAMQNNIDILTAENDLTVSRSTATRAKADYLPQVSIENNAFTWGGGGVLNTSTTGTALSVNENVYDGGVREANVASARYGVSENRARFDRTRQTVVYDVSKSYYEVLRAKRLAEVAQANVKYNEALRDQVKARAEVGQAATVDVLPVEAQLASSRVSLLSAQNKVRTSSIDLQNTIGLTPERDFDVQEIQTGSDGEIDTLDAYRACALEKRPDIALSKAAIGGAKANVRSSRLSIYPRPVVSASYQSAISGGTGNSGGQLIGGIVFDLFNGGANKAALKAAKSTQANAELQQIQTERDIRSEVEQAYLSLTSAKERVAASKLSLDAASSNFQVQKDRYAQGLGTTLDLLNAETQLISAQSDEVQARYDYYIAAAEMDYATGK